ncbi:MAG TPA: tetratricopeptide repeat protein [Candidatus Limnocylindria bacterium]|nr:tetratricopeptide repeat protein [Candidatus Limnocylindria bacterium]
MDLPPSDIHCLKAAVGWLELGDAAEALGELDQMTAASQSHPDVLEARWLALARNQRWDAAAKVARALIAAVPERPVGWLHHAYALRRATGGGVLAAFNALSPVAGKFPNEPIIHYNLACYTCQMQRDAAESIAWLQQAIVAGERKEILAMAIKDPDLEPLREEIKKLTKQVGP